MSGLPEEEHSAVGTVQVTMPATGGVSSAELVAWLKRPGERVEPEEALCLVEWDGQRAEVTAPAAGVLRMISVGPGRTVATGNSLALIDVGVLDAVRDAAPRRRFTPEPEVKELADSVPRG